MTEVLMQQEASKKGKLRNNRITLYILKIHDKVSYENASEKGRDMSPRKHCFKKKYRSHNSTLISCTGVLCQRFSQLIVKTKQPRRLDFVVQACGNLRPC